MKKIILMFLAVMAFAGSRAQSYCQSFESTILTATSADEENAFGSFNGPGQPLENWIPVCGSPAVKKNSTKPCSDAASTTSGTQFAVMGACSPGQTEGIAFVHNFQAGHKYSVTFDFEQCRDGAVTLTLDVFLTSGLLSNNVPGCSATPAVPAGSDNVFTGSATTSWQNANFTIPALTASFGQMWFRVTLPSAASGAESIFLDNFCITDITEGLPCDQSAFRCKIAGCTSLGSNSALVSQATKIGQLSSGDFGNPGTTGSDGSINMWSSLGAGDIGGAPNNSNLYGLSISNSSDKAFFGTRNNGPDLTDAIIAWGDNNGTYPNLGGSVDHLIFEFHGPADCGTSTPTEIARMLPNGTVGIGTNAPEKLLHLNQGALLITANQASNDGILFKDATNTYVPPVLNGLDGDWGIQYSAGGLNFWKPASALHGTPGNNILFLADNNNVGVGTGTPTAQLHTTAGVRFQGLNYAYENRIITSDANGNLFWTENSIGQKACASFKTSELTSDREVPMNSHFINFSDRFDLVPADGYQGRIGIGLLAEKCAKPQAKLDVYRPLVADDWTPIGVKVLNQDVAGNNPPEHPVSHPEAIGVDVQTDNENNDINIGTYSRAYNAGSQNFAVWGEAKGYALSNSAYGGNFTADGATVDNMGVVSYADGSYGSDAIGGWFTAAGGPDYNIGIYAGNYSAGANGGALPFGNNCAAFFDGDVCTTQGSYMASDEKLKTNVKEFANSLELLRKLDPKTYDFKVDEFKNSMTLPANNQIGIMAQNLQSVFPNLVKEKLAPSHIDPKTHKALGQSTKFLAVNYIGLIPVLVAAVKEVDAKTEEITTLKAALDNTNIQITALQKQIDDICNGGCAGLKGSSSTDGATPGNMLMQNVPNPFSQQSTIGYVINAGTTAYMNINSLDGKLIKHLPLIVNGAGSVSISSNEMAAGTYTYSLYVDGKVVDTKIMVITAED